MQDITLRYMDGQQKTLTVSGPYDQVARDAGVLVRKNLESGFAHYFVYNGRDGDSLVFEQVHTLHLCAQCDQPLRPHCCS